LTPDKAKTWRANMPEFLQVLLMSSVVTAAISWVAAIIVRVFVLWIARLERIARVKTAPPSTINNEIEVARQVGVDNELDVARDKVVVNDLLRAAGRVIYLARSARRGVVKPHRVIAT
jgi:hypothetical protein